MHYVRNGSEVQFFGSYVTGSNFCCVWPLAHPTTHALRIDVLGSGLADHIYGQYPYPGPSTYSFTNDRLASFINVTGLGGNDFVCLPEDNIVQGTVYGGIGDDEIIGSFGDDALYGDDGTDIIDGRAGHDKIRGGAQDDHLFGGDGDDKICGDAAEDDLYGEGGDDQLFTGGSTSAEFASGGAGADQCDLSSLPTLTDGTCETRFIVTCPI